MTTTFNANTKELEYELKVNVIYYRMFMISGELLRGVKWPGATTNQILPDTENQYSIDFRQVYSLNHFFLSDA